MEQASRRAFSDACELAATKRQTFPPAMTFSVAPSPLLKNSRPSPLLKKARPLPSVELSSLLKNARPLPSMAVCRSTRRVAPRPSSPCSSSLPSHSREFHLHGESGHVSTSPALGISRNLLRRSFSACSADVSIRASSQTPRPSQTTAAEAASMQAKADTSSAPSSPSPASSAPSPPSPVSSPPSPPSPASSPPSSWGSTDSLGDDYLYRLGKESDNLRITVGAKEGMVDSVFVGDFLGKEADIVFKYRQKVTRSFEHLQGDYYIAPAFMDKVVTFIAKNFLAESLGIKVPLILGIWGGKGQGKTFQVELIFKALGVEPIIMSAGEMESEWAGEPGQLIRSRYRDAHLVIKNKGKMSCLMINDLDAGIGRFAHTQCTVNNQMVVGTLMNLCDNPHRVSVGQEWREADVLNRVPIIVTGNDFSTLWAPLIRDDRMEKFYWQPTREDIVNIVMQMYRKDGLTRADIETLVDTFPSQALDFFGALRARTYDEKVKEWVEQQGGCHKVGSILVKRQRPGDDTQDPPTVEPPVQTVEGLIRAGEAMVREQEVMNTTRLSEEYMKVMTGPGVGLSVN